MQGVMGSDMAAAGRFMGYASLFNCPDMGGDIVQPGAFAASLVRRNASAVRMLWQHDPAQPVGRWLDIREDNHGLVVCGQLNLAVQRARELHALLLQKALDGLSIGFRAVKASRDARSGMRQLLHVDLWEISLVTFPMQPAARISETRGVDPVGARQDTGTVVDQTERQLLASIARMARAVPGDRVLTPRAR